MTWMLCHLIQKLILFQKQAQKIDFPVLLDDKLITTIN